MIASPARPGKWLDTNTPLSDHVLAEVTRQGYQGVIRYVPLPNNSPRFDISPGEAERIVVAGLQLGLVQHVRAGIWDPAAHDGRADAHAAVDAARAAGYPDGAHLWLDLEAIGGTMAATVAFAVAWEATILAAGYRAALYHGYAVPLSAADLYELPGFDSYWTDAGNRPVAKRGNAIRQSGQVVIAGTTFDEDAVSADQLGELPFVAT